MSPELQAEYDAAAKPFMEGDGAIKEEHIRMRSWRYFLEINSACNLHCPTCTKGNKEGYEHLNGIMPMEMMEQILDKIAQENPSATILTYGNSEPFLHPHLPEVIQAINRRGLRPEISSNLNFVRRVPEVLAAKPALLMISLSGWTQEVYVKGHAGGDIAKVKENMRILAETNNALPEEDRIKILVNYHVYKDNHHEIGIMAEYAKNLGIGFFTSYARAISMENAIQYCRSKDPEAVPFANQKGRPNWNIAFPEIGRTYIEAMERLHIPPTEARGMYKEFPKHEVCPVSAGTMFTFIRHDGKTQLCACTADRRISIGDYLTTDSEELSARARGHSICQQCQKYRLAYYFHIADFEKWREPHNEPLKSLQEYEQAS